MDSCLAEDRRPSLSFKSTSMQRYFKQLSGGHGNHKRSCLVSSSFYGSSNEGERETCLLRAHSALDETLLSSYFFAELKETEEQSTSGFALKGSGLVRSQSYPLEGFNSVKLNCFIKAPLSLTEGGICKVSNKELNSGKDGSLASSQPDTSLIQCVSPMMVDVTEHQHEVIKQGNQQDVINRDKQKDVINQDRQQDAIMQDKQHFTSTSSVARPTSDSLSHAKAPVNKQELPPVFTKSSANSSQHATSHVGTEIPRAIAVDAVQKEGPSMGVKVKTQPGHCAAAQLCPFGSKVLACGRRREMEDTASVVPSFTSLPCGMLGMCSCGSNPVMSTACELHFFGIYDGHGGSQASAYCKERLHFLVAEELNLLNVRENSHVNPGEGWTGKWKRTLTECFSKIDREVGGVCPSGLCGADGVGSSCTCCDGAIAPENVGTTAVVAVLGNRQIVVANCGDSRAVLSRGGKAMALSRDHKPENEDETNRIEAAGGRIICWDGYRVGGFLSLSRAIGDRFLKQYIISEPGVTCIQREDDDEVLILASDGLWDVLSNDYACEVARKGLLAARKKRENRTFSRGEDPAATTVAAILVKLAYGKGSKDNISVVVVDLKN